MGIAYVNSRMHEGGREGLLQYYRGTKTKDKDEVLEARRDVADFGKCRFIKFSKSAAVRLMNPLRWDIEDRL